MRREWKVLVISACFYLIYSALLAIQLPIRATTDEMNPLIDIHHLFELGSKQGVFEYMNGSAYQTGMTAILRILGLSPTDTEVLSPIIGAIAMGAISLILWIMYRESAPNRPWWGAIAFLPVLVVIPGFVNRLRETSHKSFTFSLVFIGLLLAFWAVQTRPDWRRYTLVLIVVSAISTFNYIWGLVYGILIASIYIFSGSRHLTVSVFPPILSFLIPNNLPTVLVEKGYFVGITTTLLGSSGGVEGGEETGSSAGGLIGGWPLLDLGVFSISSWFIWASGVFFVAALTLGANLHAIASYIKLQSVNALGKLLLVVSIYSGVVTFVLLLAGDIATVKRMIILPGLLGVVYVSAQLATSTAISGSPQPFESINFSTALVVLAILLIIFAGVGLPRVMLDGHQKPIDVYATDNEVAQVDWMAEQGPGCLSGIGRIDNILGAKTTGQSLRVVDSLDLRSNVVYSSGENGVVVCETAPPES